ncbi:gamma-glutamylcysteine synthetase [Floricoccus penangensis]|uniref:gamma-glutamylcysteine synthetase n=1 Tax=Floricoccus penangensis TaxID=1859475 RepID=UPI00203F62AB|nr:gamma-glutamylcysteine synthetase [Floricoccus penangensis]URZ87409.1 gamma-glutamylcysteine synthetase [Floricoccus penangensis]
MIQPYLLENNHSLTGLGVNPFWNKNDNTPVNSSRYRMLREYLLMAKNMDSEFRLHSHYEYPTYIQGSQVQFDISKEQLTQTINLFNKIEPAKAWLFANSYMWDEIWNTGISRDILWEDSMHGILKENVGVYDHEFIDADEVLESLADTAIFTVERGSETYYFQPLTVSEYFNREEIKAFDIEGREAILVPDINDLKLHRSYKYQSLTKRGTLEFRSICTQPLNATFSTAAFHLGLLENLSSLDTLLNQYFFFEKYGSDIKKLRRKFAFFNLSEEEKNDIIKFSNDLLNISKEGLEKRGYGEEKYLQDLVRRVEEKENPAEHSVRLLKGGKSLVDISREFANIDALK